jgi:hypothetical protein
MHCSDDILNIDLEPEYIIANDRRKNDLISPMLPFSLTLQIVKDHVLSIHSHNF